MRKLTALGIFLPLILIFCSPVSAQVPWKCDGKAIGTYNPGSNTYTDNTKLYKAVFDANGSVNYVDIPTTNGIGLNAIGFRKQDGFVYGIRYRDLANPTNQNELCRIDSTGVITVLGPVSGLTPGVQYFAGAFSNDGYLYTTVGTSGYAPFQLFKVDVTTLSATLLGDVGPYRLIDMAFDPFSNELYATERTDPGNGAANLLKIDYSTNPVGVNLIGNTGMFMFGLFFTDAGQLYGFGQDPADGTNHYYKINKSTSAITLAGAGPSALNADACSCPFRMSHTLEGTTSCVDVGEDTVVTVRITNLSTATQNTSFDLTLDKRMEFTQGTGAIQLNLQTLFPGSSITVTLSGVNGGTNNKVSINTIAVPVTSLVAPAIPFKLAVRFKPAIYALNEVIYLQSTINVPGNSFSLGNDVSDDPVTPQLDDATAFVLCPPPGGPLPVSLLSFKAVVQNNNITLNWSSSQEINTADYTIEKSLDGVRFSPIGSVTAAGYSSVNHDYSFTDRNVNAASKIYYRLRINEISRTYTYSNILALSLGRQSGFAVFPTWFSDRLNVQFSSEVPGTVQLALIDASGKVVTSRKEIAYSGTNLVAIDRLGKLSSGYYTIQLIDASGTAHQQKVMKTN